MQRLYSMFPDGWPGAGLVLLRLAVCTGIVAIGHGLPPQWRVPLVLGAVGLIAIALLIGALTPWLSVLCCLATLAVFTRDGAAAGSVTAVLTGLCAGALALLGPGAYSLDARVFGRRVLRLQPRDD